MNKTAAQGTFRQLCNELGNNIKSIFYNPGYGPDAKGIWVIEYYNGLESDTFESFFDLYNFIQSDAQG